MSEVKIRNLHLSIIRTFEYFSESQLKGHFAFLRENKDYYNQVLYNDTYLTQHNNKTIPDVGKLRAVLDESGSSDIMMADSFFFDFKKYYNRLSKSDIVKLQLTPHYPCAIDILPSKNAAYKVDKTQFPGSLTNASKVRVSFSVRLYPAGLASLRLGYYLECESGFNVADIVEFLNLTGTPITVNGTKIDLAVYAKKIMSGLYGKEQVGTTWKNQYSIVDIINSTPVLTEEQNWDKVFLPLLNLDINIDQTVGNHVSRNLSRKRDIFLIGERSAVFYSPSAKEANHKHFRRLLRNYLELLFLQKLASENIFTLEKNVEYAALMSHHFKKILRDGLKEPKINQLFSWWDYTNFHRQEYPLNGKWRKRYGAICQILDKNGTIEKGNRKAVNMINDIVRRAQLDQAKVGSWVREAFDEAIEVIEAVKPNLAKAKGS